MLPLFLIYNCKAGHVSVFHKVYFSDRCIFSEPGLSNLDLGSRGNLFLNIKIFILAEVR